MSAALRNLHEEMVCPMSCSFCGQFMRKLRLLKLGETGVCICAACIEKIRDGLLGTISEGGQGSVNSFEYDANGLRTRKVDSSGTTRYLLDGPSILEELDEVGARKAFYVNNPQRIDEVFSATTRFGGVPTKVYPLTDALGSVYALTDRNGAIVRTNSYDVYGARATSGTGPQLAFGFTGREMDPDSTLNYHRDRYLSPALGRWVQPDRISNIAGPNFYSYVLNAPVNAGDPTGFILTTNEDRIQSALNKIGDTYSGWMLYDAIYSSRIWFELVNSSLPQNVLGQTGGDGYERFENGKIHITIRVDLAKVLRNQLACPAEQEGGSTALLVAHEMTHAAQYAQALEGPLFGISGIVDFRGRVPFSYGPGTVPSVRDVLYGLYPDTHGINDPILGLLPGPTLFFLERLKSEAEALDIYLGGY